MLAEIQWNTGGYEEKLNSVREKTGLQEAVVTGKGRINGREAVIGVCDGRFFYGKYGLGCRRKKLQEPWSVPPGNSFR